MPILIDLNSKNKKEALPLKERRIPRSDMEKMLHAYEEQRRKHVRERLNIEDTVACWFSRKVYEEILEQENCDGIRIYFGVHPDGDLRGQQNAILVGTNSKDKEDLIGENNRVAIIRGLDDRNNDPYDYGQLCPPAPNCNETMAAPLLKN